ncbi:MAG: DPP IV N-terminal domain-containing protein, partial [Rhodanobacteraceae bacterium]
MRRTAFASFAFMLAFATAQAAPQDKVPAASSSGQVTLAQIMADPDWIGPPVEAPYWSVDSRAVYYRLKRAGSEIRDLYRVDAAGGAGAKLDDAQLAQADGDPVFDRARAHAAFLRHNDVYVRDIAGGSTRQLTRDGTPKNGLQFSADGTVLSWLQGDDWMIWRNGVVSQAATLKTEDDPEQKKPDDYEREQLRLFSTLRQLKADKDAQRDRTRSLDAADGSRASAPFYLGDDVAIEGTSLSPNGNWLLVVTRPKSHKAGGTDKITHYVTDSGYVHVEDSRTLVGRNPPASQSLLLLDLSARKQYPLSLDGVPGIHDDPLEALRDKAISALKKDGHGDEAKQLEAPKTRPVQVINTGMEAQGPPGIAWSDDGNNVALELRANDNKDRWIETIDFANHKLVTQNHLTDPAWINWNFNELGWLQDGRTLWFESEQSGWAQLYVKPRGGKARALTGTGYEVSRPE